MPPGLDHRILVVKIGSIFCGRIRNLKPIGFTVSAEADAQADCTLRGLLVRLTNVLSSVATPSRPWRTVDGKTRRVPANQGSRRIPRRLTKHTPQLGPRRKNHRTPTSRQQLQTFQERRPHSFAYKSRSKTRLEGTQHQNSPAPTRRKVRPNYRFRNAED